MSATGNIESDEMPPSQDRADSDQTEKALPPATLPQFSFQESGNADERISDQRQSKTVRQVKKQERSGTTLLQRLPVPLRTRPTWKRIVFSLASLILLLIIIGAGSAFTIVHNSLALTTGRITLPGLLSPVTLTRDQYGIPHILATNSHDLNFTQGFVTCQDRCYQMEQLIRLTTGRLAEVYGPGPNDSYLQTDIFFCTLNFDGVSQQEFARASTAERNQLIAYAAGVNSAITYQGQSLEDTVSGSSPLHWQPWYSLDIARLLSFGFSDWYIKLVAGLISANSPSAVAQAYPAYPSTNPILLAGVSTSFVKAPYRGLSGKSEQANASAASAVLPALANLPGSILATYAQIAQIAGIQGGHLGSNNWVLDGTLTQSGSAIEAGDPHVPSELPAFWYQVQLVVQAYPTGPVSEDTIGASIPGVPGILLGHNQWAVWSLTIADLSSENLYVLSHTGCSATKYLYNGACQPFQSRQTTINVSGQSPYHLTVYATQQGAVVLPTQLPITATATEPLPPQYAHTLALRSTLFDPTLQIGNVMALATMGNWNDFITNTNNLPLGLNWVVGTVNGQIGYRMSGVLPFQPAQALYEPVDGSTSATTWKGYVPQSQMPRLINPQGIHELVTANNQIVPLSSPLQVGGYPDQGYRAARISQLLSKIPAGTATVDSMESIQTDVTSIPAQILTMYFIDAGTNAGDTAKLAASLLSSWNDQITANSAAAAVYEVTLANLVKNVMEPKLGSALYQNWVLSSPDEGSGPTATAVAIAQHPELYFSGNQIQATATRDQEITKAESQAITTLTKQFGSTSSSWAWGKLHTLDLSEQGLGDLPLIGQVFSINNTARPGDENTVDQGGNYSQYLNTPDYTQTFLPTYRQIIDMGNQAASVWILGPGESGQPFSAHFSDQFHLWDTGGYLPMRTNLSQIHNFAHDTLTLEPLT